MLFTICLGAMLLVAGAALLHQWATATFERDGAPELRADSFPRLAPTERVRGAHALARAGLHLRRAA